MATASELLKKLSVIDLQNYKELIEYSEDNTKKRRLQISTILNNLQTKYSRLLILDKLIEDKLDDDDLPNKYTLYQSSSRLVTNRGATSINSANQIINTTLYGDIKKRKLRKRRIKTLKNRITVLQTSVTQLSSAESTLDELKTQIETALASAGG
jgi:hypothetical protein